jgi:hypothetical protein
MNNLANLLTTLFVGLKLTNHIDWSWFWVISPVLIVFTITVLIGTITGILEEWEYK